jgi:hypothetical protein
MATHKPNQWMSTTHPDRARTPQLSRLGMAVNNEQQHEQDHLTTTPNTQHESTQR